MDIVIRINCDNSAFCDIPEQEVQRILEELAEGMENGILEQSLFDFNGNKVGRLEVIK